MNDIAFARVVEVELLVLLVVVTVVVVLDVLVEVLATVVVVGTTPLSMSV